MATSGGPNIINDGLVFGYDIGYPVADNTQALRFSKGEPTTNLVVNPDFSSGDLTGWSSTSTSNSQVDINGVSIENGYYYFHKKCTSTGAGSHDRLYQSSTYELDTSLKTTVTIDIWINPSNAYTLSFYGLGSTADDTTYNEKPLSSNSSVVTTIDLGGGWTRYIYTLQTGWYTGSGNAFRVAVYPGWSGRGFMEYKVKRVQVEQKPHATPFVNGTRSATEGLKDFTSNNTIDLSTVSFDSNAQMEFDGTDDKIDITTNFGTLNAYTFEYVAYANSTHNMPISSRTSTAFYKYGAYSWRYTHGGVGSEFYHTSGNGTGWAHYAITYDGSVITVWENGISKGTRASTGTADFTGGIRIGSWSSAASYTWDGTIPIMKMYNKALTAEEVQSNYNGIRSRFGI